MTQRTIGPDGKDELRERDQVPQAGQWWFANDDSGRVYVIGFATDGQVVFEYQEGHIDTDDDWCNWHHEPRCTGWDWVVPEDKPQSESEQWPKYWKGTFLDGTVFVRQDGEGRYFAVDPNGTETKTKWSDAITSHALQITESEALALLDKPPQPAESPDDWVVQDRVPPRAHIDVVHWSHWGQGYEVVAQGTWEHPQVHGFTDCCGHSLHVRCRRRDLPVTHHATVTYTGKGVPASRVDEEPQQPKRKTVRLFYSGYDGVVIVDDECPDESWPEIHVDPATGEFFVNED